MIATIQPLLMEVAKRGNGGHTPFHTPSAVFYTEAIKLVIALCTWCYQKRTPSTRGSRTPALDRRRLRRPRRPLRCTE